MAKPGLAIMLGISKKPKAGPPMPEFGKKSSAPPKALGDSPDDTADPTDDPMAGGDEEQSEKLSQDKAGVSHADENCGNCKHFSEGDGSCEAVEGTFSPDDRCWAAYWPKDGGTGEGDTGGDTSGSADDMPDAGGGYGGANS